MDRTFTLGKFQKIDPLLRKEYKAGWKKGFAYEKDKVGFAQRIVRHMKAIPDRLDLRDRIKKLVGQIREAR